MAGNKPAIPDFGRHFENNTNWGSESRRLNTNISLMVNWLTGLMLPDDQVNSDFNSTDLDSKATILNKPYKTRIPISYGVTPDSNNLSSYVDENGVVIDFVVGDEVRYVNAVDNSIVFYKAVNVVIGTEGEHDNTVTWVISDPAGAVSTHNNNPDAHPDLRAQIINHAYFKGYVTTTANVMAITDVTPNDFVYNAETGTKWVYDITDGWVDSLEPVPDKTVPKATTLPLANGPTALIGNSEEYAAADHVHPSVGGGAGLSPDLLTTLTKLVNRSVIDQFSDIPVLSNFNLLNYNYNINVNLIATLPSQVFNCDLSNLPLPFLPYHFYISNVDVADITVSIIDDPSHVVLGPISSKLLAGVSNDGVVSVAEISVCYDDYVGNYRVVLI